MCAKKGDLARVDDGRWMEDGWGGGLIMAVGLSRGVQVGDFGGRQQVIVSGGDALPVGMQGARVKGVARADVEDASLLGFFAVEDFYYGGDGDFGGSFCEREASSPALLAFDQTTFAKLVEDLG